MTEQSSTTLQALMQFALPLGTSLVAGSPETTITWAVPVRAQPPAFADIYGGELALVSMDVLRGYNAKLTLTEVIQNLAQVGIRAVATADSIPESVATLAGDSQISLLQLPDDSSLARVERAVNSLIVNFTAQLTQRAMEIQRQLTRQAAENRDLNSLLQIIARATAKPVVIHDESGVMLAQVYPSVARRTQAAQRSAPDSGSDPGPLYALRSVSDLD